MTDAMQITVSSDMENRMDDSNSTAARTAREPERTSRPCVETVMRGKVKLQQKGRVLQQDPPRYGFK
jgi:hypothetical protein